MLEDEYIDEYICDQFNISCIGFITAGDQSGIIVKFNTFYLKIYIDNTSFEDIYLISGYRYLIETPIFEKKVYMDEFNDFAQQFKYDDYLNEFINCPMKFCIESCDECEKEY